MSGTDGVHLTAAEPPCVDGEECDKRDEHYHPAAVERILADRLAALTQDRDQLRADHDLFWRQHALAGDAVVEAVRALLDSWDSRSDRHAGTRVEMHDQLRALLPEPEASEAGS